MAKLYIDGKYVGEVEEFTINVDSSPVPLMGGKKFSATEMKFPDLRSHRLAELLYLQEQCFDRSILTIARYYEMKISYSDEEECRI